MLYCLRRAQSRGQQPEVAIKKIQLFAAIALAMCARAFSLELEASVHAGLGLASASGGYPDSLRARYESLGPSGEEVSCPSRPYLGGGGGAGLRLRLVGPLSAYGGLDLGRWGFALAGESEGGSRFAASTLGCLALAVQAELEAAFRLGPGALRPSLGLFAAAVVSDYSFDESLSGVASSFELGPRTVDRLFWGAGLGLSYLLELGRGRLGLGIRGELGLSPLSDGEGALGDATAYPARLLARLSYDFPLAGGDR